MSAGLLASDLATGYGVILSDLAGTAFPPLRAGRPLATLNVLSRPAATFQAPNLPLVGMPGIATPLAGVPRIATPLAGAPTPDLPQVDLDSY